VRDDTAKKSVVCFLTSGNDTGCSKLAGQAGNEEGKNN